MDLIRDDGLSHKLLCLGLCAGVADIFSRSRFLHQALDDALKSHKRALSGIVAEDVLELATRGQRLLLRPAREPN